MTLEIGTHVRLDGAVRSPDREGAVAHLDLDRGFAVAARASMSSIDVVDPTIRVREKLTVAVASVVDEPPLRALLAALRSLHGEIMKRPERDRSWIAVGALLFHGDDGVAIAAGDTPCFRYRDGLLASLGRASEELPAGAPRGSLGSEIQVRIEVVPLRPLPGDIYILASRPLREGELAILARSLEGSRTPGALLRTALEGGFDTGRLAVRILAPGESRVGADPSGPPPAPVVERETSGAPLAIETIAPAAAAPLGVTPFDVTSVDAEPRDAAPGPPVFDEHMAVDDVGVGMVGAGGASPDDAVAAGFESTEDAPVIDSTIESAETMEEAHTSAAASLPGSFG